MNNTSIIMYRNPLEQFFWETVLGEWGLYLLLGFAAIVILANIYTKLQSMYYRWFWSRRKSK